MAFFASAAFRKVAVVLGFHTGLTEYVARSIRAAAARCMVITTMMRGLGLQTATATAVTRQAMSSRRYLSGLAAYRIDYVGAEAARRAVACSNIVLPCCG